jgi:hypothetical protein
MAAMALKNAQLMEQKKAADEDAAEYREIELKSQRTVREHVTHPFKALGITSYPDSFLIFFFYFFYNQFEAQRAQQQDIDAARKAAADRKLKKMQGREWDLEKKEDVRIPLCCFADMARS